MQKLTSLAILSLLAACQSPAELPLIGDVFAPRSADEALEPYYRTLPDDFFPRAPAGRPLDASKPLTRILVASCFDEEKSDSAAMRSLAGEDADLFLMIGDNVYGDRDGPAYVNNQPELNELRASFSDLAAREDFKAVRAKFPMMVAWDDHDFGANDAGRDFPFRRLAERIHERFWGLENEDVGAYPGTYYARTFGPEGQRTQVIVLDTRFFRSPLTPTDAWNQKGKERYLPSADPEQDMLGNDQWTWLENRLQDPADLRLIVSSVQVLPTVHGYEAWSILPIEQQRLYRLVRETEAKGVVFVSGDRHSGFLYTSNTALPYPVSEITASSLNVSFAATTEETDTVQVGAGYPPENYGAIGIDWTAGTVSLAIHANSGERVRELTASFR
ncbi:alkaline phosphatase D family protein [Hyphomonas sp.]|jgi:alkaline phosphatase D|uniref:alkaline phosphatase D family protein n=1 Tax=Hyphomonas sp. TaxID=87 RepID=UPI0025C14E60|nr:alkaline phosphatase D family protein [Hyphomonas sp.]